MRSLFVHPHYYSAVLVARLAVNAATLLWAVLILSGMAVLEPWRFPFHARLISVVDPKYIALVILIICPCHLWCLCAKRRPVKWGIVGYMAMFLFWGYFAIALWASARPLPPGGTAWTTVGALLALYAFIANPRGEHAGTPG